MGNEDEAHGSVHPPVKDHLEREISTSSSSASDGPAFEPIRTRRTRDAEEYRFDGDETTRDELANIASILSGARSRTKSYQSDSLQRQDTVAGMGVESPEFDPNNPSFNFFLWIRKFLQLLEQENVKIRRSGFTFKNLSVSGKGAALVLQQTVGSMFMQPFRFRELFSHPEEKQILRNFNGHVNSGELLIVLGRPGSGCSTFLKSICGELQGLELSDDSKITYSGIPQDLFIKEFKGEAIYNQENEKHFPHLVRPIFLGKTVLLAEIAAVVLLVDRAN